MVIDTAPPQELGTTDDPVLRFDPENPPENRSPGRRLMFLRDTPAFELAHWCGTCPLLFKRLEGANETLSLDHSLASADELDRVIELRSQPDTRRPQTPGVRATTTAGRAVPDPSRT